MTSSELNQLHEQAAMRDYQAISKLIQYYEEIKHYDALEKLYLMLLEFNKYDLKALNNLAVLYADQLKQYDHAKHYYEQYLQVEPKDAFVHFNYGTLLETRFYDFKEAESHYQEAILIDQFYIDAYLNLSWLYLERYKDPKQAISIIEQSLVYNNSWELYAHLAYIEFNYFDAFDKALELCQKALEISPKNSLVLTYMGQIYSKMKNYDRAYESFKRAYATQKLNHILIFEFVKLLIVYYKDFSQAIEILQEAVQYFKNNAIYACYLSNINLIMGHLKEAKDYLKLAEERPVKSQESLLFIGYLKVILGEDPDDAMMYFEKVVEMNPNNLNALSIVGFYNLFKTHHIDIALSYFERIVDISPDFYPAYFIVAQIYSDINQDYDKALEYYQRMDQTKLDQNDLAFLYVVMGKLYQSGFNDTETALGYYERAYEINPDEQLAQIISKLYEQGPSLVN